MSPIPEMKTAPEPVRAPSAVPVDDAVVPFEVDALDVRGRLVRLGPALDEILSKHDYPRAGRQAARRGDRADALLGSSLKFEGRFILQTQTDGPVSLLVVDFTAPDRLRAYARFDAARVGDAEDPDIDPGELLGHGHLAMTIDQGPDMSRYQGLVALDGGSLEDAAHEYFLRSEQIPTRVRLAVGEELRAGRRRQASLARRRHADAVPAEGAGARAAGRSASRRCARWRRGRTASRKTMPGSRGAR